MIVLFLTHPEVGFFFFFLKDIEKDLVHVLLTSGIENNYTFILHKKIAVSSLCLWLTAEAWTFCKYSYLGVLLGAQQLTAKKESLRCC